MMADIDPEPDLPGRQDMTGDDRADRRFSRPAIRYRPQGRMARIPLPRLPGTALTRRVADDRAFIRAA